ncbi:MAG: hypothetical protein DMG80_12365 [Acidobacteria bacterium]|jgi:CDI toxin RNase A-like protein|nr:MAG: hypothetical protein DMG80_12365 [Acidobacteriota bacterium]
MRKQFLFWMAALLMGGTISCQSSPSASPAAAPDPTESGKLAARAEFGQRSPRDLAQDEAAGGHVLRKHVGRSDDELRARLSDERHISAASTYTDRATAERAIDSAISTSQDRIQRWLKRSGGHPNLVLDYESNQPLGRTLNRGEKQSRPCSHAVVVLRYAAPSYYVLTSYPECRS